MALRQMDMAITAWNMFDGICSSAPKSLTFPISPALVPDSSVCPLHRPKHDGV